jgi:hypothetical protein
MKHLKEFNSYASQSEMTENAEMQNYMFFQNLMTIKDSIDMMLSLDPMKVDSILTDGHAWAADHITTSADDIQEVSNFLKNTIKMMDHSEMPSEEMPSEEMPLDVEVVQEDGCCPNCKEEMVEGVCYNCR